MPSRQASVIGARGGRVELGAHSIKLGLVRPHFQRSATTAVTACIDLDDGCLRWQVTQTAGASSRETRVCAPVRHIHSIDLAIAGVGPLGPSLVLTIELSRAALVTTIAYDRYGTMSSREERLLFGLRPSQRLRLLVAYFELEATTPLVSALLPRASPLAPTPSPADSGDAGWGQGGDCSAPSSRSPSWPSRPDTFHPRHPSAVARSPVCSPPGSPSHAPAADAPAAGAEPPRLRAAATWLKPPPLHSALAIAPVAAQAPSAAPAAASAACSSLGRYGGAPLGWPGVGPWQPRPAHLSACQGEATEAEEDEEDEGSKPTHGGCGLGASPSRTSSHCAHAPSGTALVHGAGEGRSREGEEAQQSAHAAGSAGAGGVGAQITRVLRKALRSATPSFRSPFAPALALARAPLSPPRERTLGHSGARTPRSPWRPPLGAVPAWACDATDAADVRGGAAAEKVPAAAGWWFSAGRHGGRFGLSEKAEPCSPGYEGEGGVRALAGVRCAGRRDSPSAGCGLSSPSESAEAESGSGADGAGADGDGGAEASGSEEDGGGYWSCDDDADAYPAPALRRAAESSLAVVARRSPRPRGAARACVGCGAAAHAGGCALADEHSASVGSSLDAAGGGADGPAAPSLVVHLTVLPRWVKLIPPQAYSPGLRRLIESVVAIWSAVSIVWAFWQLYRNLPLLRELTSPFVRLLYRYLDALLSHANALLHQLTEVWAHYLRPVELLVGPLCVLLERLATAALLAGASVVQAATLVAAPLGRSLGLAHEAVRGSLAGARAAAAAVLGLCDGGWHAALACSSAFCSAARPAAQSALALCRGAGATLSAPFSLARALLVRVRIIRPARYLLDQYTVSAEVQRVNAIKAFLSKNARRVVEGTTRLTSPTGALMRSPTVQQVILQRKLAPAVRLIGARSRHEQSAGDSKPHRDGAAAGVSGSVCGTSASAAIPRSGSADLPRSRGGCDGPAGLARFLSSPPPAPSSELRRRGATSADKPRAGREARHAAGLAAPPAPLLPPSASQPSLSTMNMYP